MRNGGGEGGEEERIFVSVRVRPLISQEIEKNDHSKWEIINNNTIILKNNAPDRSVVLPCAYTFDRVFGPNSDTRQVYEEGAKEVALSVVNGINSSIFAYGQTSSGKTYTMNGITVYTVEDIYEYIQKHEEREFILKFSAIEIYNEGVSDLLSSDNTPLRLLDDPERGTVVEKLTEVRLRDKCHLEDLLAICEDQRQIGETSLNEASSRSHQILRLTIESSARHHDRDSSSSLAATVNFVDLAGSERASQTLSAGTKLKEGSHINRSLLTLGTVIRKLSKGRNTHVPYRDSKLTRILQNSLGGNARTAIICTMSPARIHDEQSRNTLLFASCAKEVTTNANVNVIMSDKALVKHLQRELVRLEDELHYLGSTHTTTHLDELKEKDTKIIKMEKEIRELIQQRNLAQSRLHNLLSSVGDDQALRLTEEYGRLMPKPNAHNLYEDDHSSRHWGESIQLSVGHQPVASEDESSISQASGISYHSPEFGISKCRFPYVNDSYDRNHLKSENSVNSARYFPRNTYQSPRIPQSQSGSLDDQCKEVRCIEINDLKKKADESSLLLDDCDSLLPMTFEAKEPSLKAGNSFGLALQNQVKMTQTSDNLMKPVPDVLTPRCANSQENPACSTKSFCLEDIKHNNNTPTYSLLKDFQRRPENVSTGNSSASSGRETEVRSRVSQKLEISTREELKVEDVAIASEDKLRARGSKNAYATSIPSISNHVEQLEEVPQSQNQKQLVQNQEMHQNPNENYKVEEAKNVASNETLSSSSESPSQWPSEFKKQQREIIELWDTCNVSLIHRTYFFLLFKGEPTDSSYMEVEHRRLSFLKRINESGTVASSLKNLQRERAMLHRRIQKKLSSEERNNLYIKWGIEVDSKKRKMRLAKLLWTDTKDIEYVKESASLVAKLIGLLEPELVLKETFGLSFMPRECRRRSFRFNLMFSSR
ncbi:hypothetical protein KFK09_000037 [Dendrobium nobile]|uniref:Kinesin-like protein n=1 Tax=Dendrobium nobile TaxID=94219 RepID=A0A8T3CDK2_DENNO|nr:hypothetical protein KFK09_000037 [Dendrobium nobile]